MFNLQVQDSLFNDERIISVLVTKDELPTVEATLKSSIDEEELNITPNGNHDNILLVVVKRDGKVFSAYQPLLGEYDAEVTRLVGVAVK